MSDIASDVREIKESKSKFGTKLPGNGNKAQELTLKELSYEQMIMGSIASLVWGVKNINKDTQVKTLLGRNNIFDIIKNIQTEIPISFDNFYKKLDELITKLSNNIANNLTQFSNLLIIPKFDELIKAVEKSYKEKGSLKDSTTKILIDLKAADTIEQILKDFDALDGIVIFDNDNVNHVQDLLDRIDKLSKEDIYLVINTNLYDTVKELKELKIDIYDPASLDNIKAEIENLKSEQINLFNLDDLNEAKNIFESIQKIQMNADTENILMGISKFLDAIENSKFDITKKSKVIEDLINFFGGKDSKQKNTLNNLLTAINSLGEDGNKSLLKGDHIKTLATAFSIVGDAAKLMEGHDVKINKKFFKDLNSLLKNDDYIKGIIINLSALKDYVISKDIQVSIGIVDDFVTTISNLGNLGFIKLIKSKIAIKAINAFLIKDIKSLIDEVVKFKTTQKDTDKAFEALDHLFDAVTKLGDITISDKRKMAKNIIFIEKFLAEDIRHIIEESIPSLRKNQKEGFEVLEKTKGIIDSLIAIGDIDEQKLDIASDKIDDIKDFIKDDISELIKFIAETLGDKKQLKKVISVTDMTHEIFENIGDMNDAIPGVMSLIKSNTKVMLLAIEFAFIEESFNTLAKLSKILKPKDKQFLSNRFDGTLDSIIEINGVLA